MATIPAHDINGVIPPYLGSNPGGPSSDMSPYLVSLPDVIDRFGTSRQRIEILEGFLNFRAALRAVGITSGFQWINGSFVEDVEMRLKRPPNDIDIVTFVSKTDSITLNRLSASKHPVTIRAFVKPTYKCDSFIIAMDTTPELLVDFARYFLGLFSHQRDTRLWKGMLQVPLYTSDNANRIIAAKLRALTMPGVAP